jgi:excisionase family DNA binding protein
MDDMDDGRLAYGLREAAEKLGGVSVRSVQRLVARGALPTVRVLRRVLIPAEALRAFVANADPTHNSPRAESVAWKESKPWHTDARTHRTGGSNTPTQAAKELTVLLAQLSAGKRKHSKPNGG